MSLIIAGRRITLVRVTSHSPTLASHATRRTSSSWILYTGDTKLKKNDLSAHSDGSNPLNFCSINVRAHVSSFSTQWNHKNGIMMRWRTNMGSLLVNGVITTHTTSSMCSTQIRLAANPLASPMQVSQDFFLPFVTHEANALRIFRDGQCPGQEHALVGGQGLPGGHQAGKEKGTRRRAHAVPVTGGPPMQPPRGVPHGLEMDRAGRRAHASRDGAPGHL